MPRRNIDRPVRYAVVGLGHIAQVAVLPAFAHAGENSRLSALVSDDDEKLSALTKKSADIGRAVELPPYEPIQQPQLDQAIRKRPVRKPKTVNADAPHS